MFTHKKYLSLLLVAISFEVFGQVTFQDVSDKIFRPLCLECHVNPGAPGDLDLSRYENIIDKKAVVPFKPEASLIFEKVSSGEMPFGGDSLTADQLALVEAWINDGALPAPPAQMLALDSVEPRWGDLEGKTLVTLKGSQLNTAKEVYFDGKLCTELKLIDEKSLQCSTPARADAGVIDVRVASDVGAAILERAYEYRLKLGPTYASIFANIFKPKCVACHSGDNPPKNLDLSDYGSMMSHRRAIIPFDVKKSRVYKKVREGEMPLKGTKLTNEQISAIANWISRGALKN